MSDMIYSLEGPNRHNHQMVRKRTAGRGRSHIETDSGLQQGRLSRYSPSLECQQGGVDHPPCCHELLHVLAKGDSRGRAALHGRQVGKGTPNEQGNELVRCSWLDGETLVGSHERT